MTADRPLALTAAEATLAARGALREVRRVMRPQPTPWTCNAPGMEDIGGLDWRGKRYEADTPDGIESVCPLGVAGDTLWCQQTWCPLNRDYRPAPADMPLPVDGEHVIPAYQADHDDPRGDAGPLPWRAAETLPRWASRHTLRVRAVRVERDAAGWCWVVGVEAVTP